MHYIKHNAGSRVPSRFVFFDTEANESRQGYDRVQSWRLAVTACDWRYKGGDLWQPTSWNVHRDPADLWTAISAFTRANRRTVVVAHNLAYDLRISDAFRHLSALRWQLVRLSLHDRAVGAILRRDRRTLVLCDSMAFLPMGLDKIGALVGIRKPDLPDFGAGDDQWVARCTADVAILRAAMLDLLAWIESDGLGNWQRTGAGQAWNAWRHRHYTHRVLVHDDIDARAAEAEACYTGRTEAWRHGTLRHGPFVSFDLPMAYSNVAADLDVPVKLIGHGTRRTNLFLTNRKPGLRHLCRASVETDTPVLPHHSKGRTLWPVGRFDGWWWDDELAEAMHHGAQIEVHETYKYAARPALRSWAHWVIAASGDEHGRVTTVRHAFAKNLARALIGRFAVKFTPWEFDSPADESRDTVERVYYPERATHGRLVTLGSETWQGIGEQYGSDACVFVMSAVMAECRIRLWRAMLAAGLEHVVYCDTDGLIVDQVGAQLLAAWVSLGNGWGLRVKGTYSRLDVLGPRQLIVDGQPRISGVPYSARRVNGNTWAGEVWATLPGSLQRREPDTVRITPRSWIVRGVDHRRVHLSDGTTAPVVIPWHAAAGESVAV
jgi:hypothetical protein